MEGRSQPRTISRGLQCSAGDPPAKLLSGPALTALLSEGFPSVDLSLDLLSTEEMHAPLLRCMPAVCLVSGGRASVIAALICPREQHMWSLKELSLPMQPFV